MQDDQVYLLRGAIKANHHLGTGGIGDAEAQARSRTDPKRFIRRARTVSRPGPGAELVGTHMLIPALSNAIELTCRRRKEPETLDALALPAAIC
jgi:hypothetical protein